MIHRICDQCIESIELDFSIRNCPDCGYRREQKNFKGRGEKSYIYEIKQLKKENKILQRTLNKIRVLSEEVGL